MPEQLPLDLFPLQHCPLSLFEGRCKDSPPEFIQADFPNQASTRLVFYESSEVVEAFMKSDVENWRMVGRCPESERRSDGP